MNTNALKVGDRVYVVKNDNEKSGREMTVEKVGRQWVWFDSEYRVARGDSVKYLDGKGYSSMGEVYETEAAYVAETAKQETWAELRRQIERKYRIDDLTIENIEAAANLLNVSLEA